MRTLTRFLIPAFLSLFAVASAQLPPKVIADKYLMRAEQLLEKQDYKAALNMVEKIFALQKEYNLTLSDNLYFKDAVAQWSYTVLVESLGFGFQACDCSLPFHHWIEPLQCNSENPDPLFHLRLSASICG